MGGGLGKGDDTRLGGCKGKGDGRGSPARRERKRGVKRVSPSRWRQRRAVTCTAAGGGASAARDGAQRGKTPRSGADDTSPLGGHRAADQGSSGQWGWRALARRARRARGERRPQRNARRRAACLPAMPGAPTGWRVVGRRPRPGGGGTVRHGGAAAGARASDASLGRRSRASRGGGVRKSGDGGRRRGCALSGGGTWAAEPDTPRADARVPPRGRARARPRRRESPPPPGRAAASTRGTRIPSSDRPHAAAAEARRDGADMGGTRVGCAAPRPPRVGAHGRRGRSRSGFEGGGRRGWPRGCRSGIPRGGRDAAAR